MIQAQILKDKDGVSMDVEEITGDLPQWEKDFIDTRLETANKHPGRLHPPDQLFQ
ncbi:hypothetical protein [Limibacterium fermenti]|uniref:hypothetical protein n=1 Tax=Limibacterium fermenti TaxID=3229863 RepID=UPI0026C5DD40